jgi:hypothetical protein
MAVPAWTRSAGVTAADRGRAVAGVALGRQPAVRLLVPKAELPVRPRWVSRERVRPPAERAVRHFALLGSVPPRAGARTGRCPALHAIEAVGKVSQTFRYNVATSANAATAPDMRTFFA